MVAAAETGPKDGTDLCAIAANARRVQFPHTPNTGEGSHDFNKIVSPRCRI